MRIYLSGLGHGHRVLDKARRGIYADIRAAPIPERLNLLEHDFGLREKMDVIFCRNVRIYFDRSTQEQVLRRVCDHLVTGGYLFIGHSETINGLGVPLAPVANTISRKL